MKRAAVRAFLLALLLFPVSFAGCGPSYEDAVKVYEAELSILDKLENDRRRMDEEFGKYQGEGMSLSDRLNANKAIYSPDDFQQRRQQLDKNLDDSRKDYDADSKDSDAKLKEQRKRVSDAKALVDRLAK